MFNKIKAIKDLRTQAKQMQNKLEEVVVEGSGAWGKVKVKINGNQKILAVDLAEDILGDKEKLETGIKDAFNDAFKKMQKEMAGKMKDLGGLQDMMKNIGM